MCYVTKTGIKNDRNIDYVKERSDQLISPENPDYRNITGIATKELGQNKYKDTLEAASLAKAKEKVAAAELAAKTKAEREAAEAKEREAAEAKTKAEREAAEAKEREAAEAKEREAAEAKAKVDREAAEAAAKAKAEREAAEAAARTKAELDAEAAAKAKAEREAAEAAAKAKSLDLAVATRSKSLRIVNNDGFSRIYDVLPEDTQEKLAAILQKITEPQKLKLVEILDKIRDDSSRVTVLTDFANLPDTDRVKYLTQLNSNNAKALVKVGGRKTRTKHKYRKTSKKTRKSP